MRRPINTAARTEVSKEPNRKPADASSDAADQAAARSVAARLTAILTLLDDEKAEDVVSIDLRDKSSIADHMVIASGRSARHVGAICEKMIDMLKREGGPRPRAEGVANGDWALIDVADIVVHVFRPEVREFYALEKMWGPAERAGGGAP